MLDENMTMKVALFRYSLIAPIITDTFTQGSAKEYFECICARKHSSPNGDVKEYAPATLKSWLSLYRKFGIDGLYPKSRSDKGSLRKVPDEVKDFIVSSKLSNPKRSAKYIYHQLLAKGYISLGDVSLSTIQRFISSNKLSFDSASSIDRRAFEFESVNDCWQSDISVGPYITVDGKKRKTYIIAIIDDFSRLITYAEAFYSENLLSLLSVFKSAVSTRGIPKKLFVDNGKVFRSNQIQFICASIGCILCFARPYSPESKGKIERWFRSLHSQWMNITDWNEFSSIENVNESLFAYVSTYNSSYHSSISSNPIDRFSSSLDSIRFVSSKKELDYIFLYRVIRKVRGDSTISINNVLFETPHKYMGEKVNVRYDPTSLDKAFIFSEPGILLDTIYPVKKVDNSKIRREHNVRGVDFSVFSSN